MYKHQLNNQKFSVTFNKDTKTPKHCSSLLEGADDGQSQQPKQTEETVFFTTYRSQE